MPRKQHLGSISNQYEYRIARIFYSTANKTQKPSSYHHCTLLKDLRTYLGTCFLS